MALPLGEQMSAHIFAACLNELGAKGVFVDSARVVATDDKFGDASPDMDATRRQCADALEPAPAARPDPGRDGLQWRNSRRDR